MLILENQTDARRAISPTPSRKDVTMIGDPEDPDLAMMARDELASALTLSWRALAKIVPWGDSFEGISPAGRDVSVERGYIWLTEPGGDILCEIVVQGLGGHTAKAAAEITAPRP